MRRVLTFHIWLRAGWYSPKTSPMLPAISPTVAQLSTASRIAGIRLRAAASLVRNPVEGSPPAEGIAANAERAYPLDLVLFHRVLQLLARLPLRPDQ